MVKLKCYHWGSDRLVRNGLTQNGKQRSLCSDCRRMSRDDPQANGYTEEQREQILRASHERSSRATCQKLWAAVPAVYRRAHCWSDFREAYQLVPPAEQRTAAGKESGLTAHVERWNNTLRQRLGRFVRKSLSFSTSDMMHELCLRLFLHDYNKSLALSSD
jgi:IS1 family transposase